MDDRVHAAVVLCGPTNLTTLNDPPAPPTALDAGSLTSRLLGATAKENVNVAISASPKTYVSRTSPPMLLVYGTSDVVVPVSQGITFDAAMNAAGADSTLIRVDGAGHATLVNAEVGSLIAKFIEHVAFDVSKDFGDQIVPLKRR
jgi:dipeptidyl aminopeptidase/acylaminoacyl peptidase